VSAAPLVDQLARFERYLVSERRAALRTTETYMRDLRALASFLETTKGPADAALLDVRHLRGFLASTPDAREPATLQRKVSALRAFYRFLLRRGGATRNPASELKTPKLRRKLPHFLSVEKSQEVMEMPPAVGTLATHARDQAMLELLYGSGVRVSELCGLDIDAVDLQAGNARVLGKGSKERIVPVGKKAREAITSYLAVRGELRTQKDGQDPRAMFLSERGKRLGVRQVQNLVKRYGMLATGTAELHPHALRHSCATHLLDAGADLRSIQELLGHASLSTTQRYTHVSMDQLQAVYTKAHPLAKAR
jgi:integrase/recombinase XerC